MTLCLDPSHLVRTLIISLLTPTTLGCEYVLSRSLPHIDGLAQGPRLGVAGVTPLPHLLRLMNWEQERTSEDEIDRSEWFEPTTCCTSALVEVTGSIICLFI